jgi:transposase
VLIGGLWCALLVDEVAELVAAGDAELRELRRKCRELEQTIEVLKAATSFFAWECDPLHR